MKLHLLIDGDCTVIKIDTIPGQTQNLPLPHTCEQGHNKDPVFTRRQSSGKIGYMEEKGREPYPSDLTDEQREEISSLYTGMRNCTWSKRELTDAVLYLVDSECKWRQLPHDFPPYSTVHSFYRRARISGLWDKILEHLVKRHEQMPDARRVQATRSLIPRV